MRLLTSLITVNCELCYLNSDNHKSTEEYLGMVKVIGMQWGRGILHFYLWNFSTQMYQQQHERNKYEWRTEWFTKEALAQKVPNTKYVHYLNNRLALIFAHPLLYFKVLQDAHSVLLFHWKKKMKYSTIKNAAFGEVQETKQDRTVTWINSNMIAIAWWRFRMWRHNFIWLMH